MVAKSLAALSEVLVVAGALFERAPVVIDRESVEDLRPGSFHHSSPFGKDGRLFVLWAESTASHELAEVPFHSRVSAYQLAG